MGLAAIYCHPLEFFVSDLMSRSQRKAVGTRDRMPFWCSSRPLGAGLAAIRTNAFTGVLHSEPVSFVGEPLIKWTPSCIVEFAGGGGLDGLCSHGDADTPLRH